MRKHRISIIIPAYNAAQWIGPTVDKIANSLANAPDIQADIIIVNDGSNDKTSEAAHSLSYLSLPVTVIDQKNAGRFMARKTGLDKAKGDFVFFIDSRVFIHEQSFAFLSEQLSKHPERKVWNGHVHVAKEGNIIARFGDAITFIGWRRYFHHPKLTSYGLEDFDYYPKGTGCFFVPRSLLTEATDQFLKTTRDLRYSSDDTLLIRLIAEQEKIWLSPRFSCTYHARTKISQFIKHTFGRGMFFVDGFLRPGTRFYYPLIGFLIISVISVLSIIIFPALLPYVAIILASLWTLELLIAIVLGTPVKDAFSLFLLSPIFMVAYGLGIWRATLKRLLGV